ESARGRLVSALTFFPERHTFYRPSLRTRTFADPPFPQTGTLMDYLVDLFLHLDVHLNDMAGNLGPWLYLILFAIIFCETGLVVTPFLPGDSLLFAVGAVAASKGSPINIVFTILLLIAAGILGDALN